MPNVIHTPLELLSQKQRDLAAAIEAETQVRDQAMAEVAVANAEIERLQKLSVQYADVMQGLRR